MNAFGLASWAGRLYTYDQIERKIKELDPLTGATVKNINIGLSENGEGALTFRADGIGFLAVSDGSIGTLYSFDIGGPGIVPSSTWIGNLNFSMDGMDFYDGVLYGLNQYGKNLYSINQNTGAVILIGATGISDVDSLGGLAFSSDGTLFAAMNTNLYTLNTGTGVGSLVGAIGFGSISGITSLDLDPVPLPGAVWLMGSGLLGLVGWRRFRKS